MNNQGQIDDTIEYCTKVLMMWFFDEKDNPTMSYNDRDKEFLEKSFIARVLLKKFEVFDIKIHLPVHLLMLISLCANENPGQSQLILKQLLLSIKNAKGPIPEGYIITHYDFVMCFHDSFPIMEIPKINENYMKLWNQQKKQGKIGPTESDNLCDTVEWWKEVMQ